MTDFATTLSGASSGFSVREAESSWAKSDLEGFVENLRASYQAYGLYVGARIGVLLPDHPLTPSVILGLCDLARVLPMNPNLSSNELSQIVKDARLDAVLTLSGTDVSYLGDISVIYLERGWTGHIALPPEPTQFGAPSSAPGLLLLTSGSTGSPKRVQLVFEQLLQSAKTIAETLDLGPKDRALAALPMFHIGALVDLFLAPMVSGGSVRISADRSPAGLLEALSPQDCTWTQMVPTMLAQYLNSWSKDEVAAASKGLRFLRSVSSDLASDAHQRFEDELGGVPIIQMYGMTETAGQIASNPAPPKARKPGSVGQIFGIELSITDADGSPLPDGSTGEICLRGPTVTVGYEDVDRQSHFFGDWFRTGDLGRLDEDGFLWLVGRRKEMINRGGEKISPMEIERVALSSSSVSEAAAYGVAHPTLGEVVGLCVVLTPEGKREAVETHLKENLADFKRPRTLVITDALPRLGSGKVDKLALRAAAETDQTPRTETTWTGLASEVAELWKSKLNSATPRAEDDFFDAGGDSLAAAEFLLALEARTGRELNQSMLYDAPSFAEFVKAVEAAPKKAAAEASDPVQRYLRDATMGWSGRAVGQSGQTFGLQLLAPGAPVFYASQGEVQPFQALLGPDHPLYTMRTLMGMKGRTADHNAQLAHQFAEDILSLAPEGPICLAGFCEGARILELAVPNILAAGREIGFFLTIDHFFKAPAAFPVIEVLSQTFQDTRADWFTAPERGKPIMFPLGVAEVLLADRHMNALLPDVIAPVAQVLRDALAGKRPKPLAQPNGPCFEARQASWQADIGIGGARLLSRERKQPIRVAVTNTSQTDWPAFDDGGPAISVHFRNFDNYIRVHHSGYAPLPKPVPAGDTIELEVPMTYPATGLPQLVTARMVDEGLAIFGGRTFEGTRRLVWANPFKARHWKD